MKTKKKLFLIIFFLQVTLIFSQEEKKVVDFFDSDNLSDTLFYKDLRYIDQFRDKDISYSFKIFLGNGKKQEFNLHLGYEYVQISSPKKGYLEIYQWKTGSQGFEQYETYKFNIELDTWFLQKIVTTNSDGKEKIYVPKQAIRIDKNLKD